MNLRFPLRWKILVLTVPPLVALVVTTLWIVNRNITRQVDANTRNDLLRASALFENMLATRAHSIATAGEVIVRDPRFFSVLTLPGSYRDPIFRSTVRSAAGDFSTITGSDLFEIYGRDGTWIASAARRTTPAGANAGPRFPASLVSGALRNHATTTLLVGRDGHYQISVTPVLAGGHVVGALLLGSRIDRQLAEELRGLTRSEVSFLSGNVLTGTTLELKEDRDALIGALAELGPLPLPGTGHEAILRVEGRNHTYLTLARPIPDAAPGRRQVYVMQRSLDAETAYLNEIQRVLVEIGVIAVLAALLAGFLISEHITSPVRRLVHAATQLERGNFDERLEIKSGDEIGSLAATFEAMRAHLRVYVSTLEEVTRLRSEFISIASHELRTPITIIRGLQELMDAEALGPVTAEQKQALRSMDQSLSTLTKIAEDATRMSLIEGERLTLELEDAPISGVVEQAVEAANASADGRSVAVHTEVAPRLPLARVDAPRLTLALANLVRNGIRFTPDGGRVTVRAREDDGVIVIEVEDTGIGMSEEQRRLVFDRAWSPRPSEHHHSSSTLEFNSAGLGLGLPIARGIIEAHDGSLEIRGEPGRGTLVSVRLPLRPLEVVAAA
ncbi:MAG TPA: ATP-binding protein [Candidatus Eisenbacteria bacterium]